MLQELLEAVSQNMSGWRPRVTGVILRRVVLHLALLYIQQGFEMLIQLLNSKGTLSSYRHTHSVTQSLTDGLTLPRACLTAG